MSAGVKDDMAGKGDDVASIDKSIEVSNCPLRLEVCFPSCFWRKGDRCIFYSKRGRRIVQRLTRLEKRKAELGQRVEEAKQSDIVIDDMNKACKVMRCMLWHQFNLKDMRKTLERLNIRIYLDGDRLYLTGELLLPEDQFISEKDLSRLCLINQYQLL